MNNERRKRIREVITQLNGCSSSLESIRDDEDDSRDSTPENLQNGEVYCFSEECSGKLEDAISDIQGVVENLENIV